MVQATFLVVVVLVAFAIVGPLAGCIGGSMALAAASVAALSCLAGAALALMASALLPGPKLALAALLIGMAARMGTPFAVGLAIHLQGGPLAKAGLLYYLLVFYPITLTAEILLSLPSARRSQCDATESAKT